MSITCGVCGFQFDPGDLDAVLFHETHFHHPDIQYSGSKKIETIESLQSQLAAEKEARVKAEFMLEQCRDSAKALLAEIDGLKIAKELAEAENQKLREANRSACEDFSGDDATGVGPEHTHQPGNQLPSSPSLEAPGNSANLPRPFFQIRDVTECESHKQWVAEIKTANLSPIKPASEVTPIFKDDPTQP